MPFAEEKLTQKIIQCIIKVHQILGPGFLECIYRNALVIELKERGYSVESEKPLSIFYLDREVGKHRLDLLIQNKVVVEIKSVEFLHSRFYAQLKSYLRAAGCNVGLLVNFGAEFRRVDIK